MAKAVKLKNSLYLSSTSIVHKRGGGWYYLNNLLDNIYPVGSIFISTVNTNPSTYFGGTWERIKGRFLLAADDSTYKLGGTGGESAHKLTYNELPSEVVTGYCADNQKSWATGYWSNYSSAAYPTNVIRLSGQGTGNQAHNNMPPYLVVYIWKRVS